LTVFDRIIEIPKISTMRIHISNYLQILYKLGHQLPEQFGAVPPEAFLNLPPIPFLPAAISPVEFLACSTLPSLFGHCWSPEMQISYFSFLCRVAKASPDLTLANFRQHWLFECFSSYISCSDLHDYLHSSIGEIMFEILHIEHGNVQTHSPEFYSRAIHHINNMLRNLRANLSILPQDVRLLIRMFADLATTDQERIQRIEILVLECLISKAIMNPKNYGIVPATYQIADTSIFSFFASLWGLFLHPIPGGQLSAHVTDLQKADFIAFLNEIVDVNSDLLGPSAVKWMTVTNAHNLFMVFSIPDISLLAYFTMYMNVSASVVNTCQSLIRSIQELDFRLFRYECWEFDLYVFDKPDIGSASIEIPPENEQLAHCANTLYRFLGVAPERSEEPPGLKEFLEFQAVRAKLEHDFKSRSILHELIREIDALNIDENELLRATQAELEQKQLIMLQNDAIVTEIMLLIVDFQTFSKCCERKMEETRSILWAHLLQSFLSQNPDVLSTFQLYRKNFVKEIHLFREFFQSVTWRIEEFLKPKTLGDHDLSYAFKGVISHLHTQLLQFVPLCHFLDEHPTFAIADFRQLKVATREEEFAARVSDVCGQLNCFRGGLSSLFSVPAAELAAARLVELPMEAIQRIVKFTRALKELLAMVNETEGHLRQAILFTIMTKQITAPLSFSKYLAFFLLDIGVLDEIQQRDLLEFVDVSEKLDAALGEPRDYYGPSGIIHGENPPEDSIDS
jgi:hypothetical protein